MLLGIIKDETNNIEYYIDSENKDNYSELSITRVDSTTTRLLSKEEFSNLLKTIFSSKLTYKEEYKDYSVYLDEANNKRYFKNGREDLFMFLENNGVSAINYFEKESKKPKSKIYNVVVANIVFSLILSSTALIPLAGDMQLRQRADITISSIIPLSAEELSNTIRSSKNLTEEQKNALCNEDYFNFVLENVDSRRNYSLRKSVDEIKIKTFDKSVMENADGYFDPLHPNTIYVLDSNVDKDDFLEIIIHEFIHMTQNCKYSYVREAACEIAKNEFYKKPIIAYPDNVKRLKVLTEIIGPEPIIKCVYNPNDNTFEKELAKYLSPDEVNEFLLLLGTHADDINNPNFNSNEVHQKIDEYLAKIYHNKTGNDIKDDVMIRLIYNGGDKNRVYFNYNLENYNKDYFLFTDLVPIEEASINSIIENNTDIIYEYTVDKQETVNGKDITHSAREQTNDFSAIPTNHKGFVKLIFTDDTVGYVYYNTEEETWGTVKRYEVIDKYEPSIPKKFPNQVSKTNKKFEEEINEMINDVENTESEAKSI